MIDAVHEEFRRGSDPQSDAVQALARRWQKLVDAFTGSDESVERELYDRAAIYGQLRAGQGHSIPDLVDYMQKALVK